MAKLPILAVMPILIALSPPWVAQEPTGERPVPSAQNNYTIGVEDVLRVMVWGEPDLDTTQKVRPDGRVTVPLVNDVHVAGLSTDEVRLRITEGLSEYIRGPNVTVLVEEINSIRVYLLGEVSNQGPLRFYRPTRLLQAISMAGGLTEFSKKNITILRDEFGVERRIEVDYKKLWAGDPAQENLFLRPGDTLLVR